MPELVPTSNTHFGPAMDIVNHNFGQLSLYRTVKNKFSQSPPVADVDYDTGYIPIHDSVKDVSIILIVNIGGVDHGIFQEVKIENALGFPDVKLAVESEFGVGTGNVTLQVWYSKSTGTIHFSVHVDGGDKTLQLAVLQETRWNIHPLRQRYYFVPDGLSQDITLAEPYTTSIGEPINISFRGGTINNFYGAFILDDLNTFGVSGGIAKTTFSLTGCTALLDGVPITHEVTPIPTSGNHTLTIYPTADGAGAVITRLLGNAGGNRTNLSLFNIVFGDGLEHSYPIDDGSVTHIRNNGSVADATPNGFSASGWISDDYPA